MANRDDDIFNKPLPTAKVPGILTLLLLCAVVFFYLGFLRSPQELLGPLIKANEYLGRVTPAPKVAPTLIPVPPPIVAPAPAAASPAPQQSKHHAHPAAPAVQPQSETPATPAATDTTPAPAVVVPPPRRHSNG